LSRERRGGRWRKLMEGGRDGWMDGWRGGGRVGWRGERRGVEKGGIEERRYSETR
jgi:hypothetical protein